MSDRPYHFLCHRTFSPEGLERALALTTEVVQVALTFPGALRVDLFQEVENPTVVHLVESWESRAALDHWLASAPMTTYRDAVEPYAVDLTFIECTAAHSPETDPGATA